MQLDLASFESIRRFVAAFREKELPLHLLVNNAGVMLVPYALTTEGYEMHVGVNYIGHFLLTRLLLGLLSASGKSGKHARIINVSSSVHVMGTIDLSAFSPRPSPDAVSAHGAYGDSKLAIMLFTRYLSKTLKQHKLNIDVNTVHPGVVDSALYRHLSCPTQFTYGIARHMMYTPKQGAETAIFLATNSAVEGVSGQYFIDCHTVGGIRRGIGDIFEQSSVYLPFLFTHTRPLNRPSRVSSHTTTTSRLNYGSLHARSLASQTRFNEGKCRYSFM